MGRHARLHDAPTKCVMDSATLDWTGPTSIARRPGPTTMAPLAGWNDVAGDELFARAGCQAERERCLQGRAGVERPDSAPRVLHRRPRRAGAALHELHGREVAVAVLVLDEDGEVVGVRAGVYDEG